MSDGNALLAEIDALLVAWRPGTQGGPAITNLLFGDANPSGRLAQSWLRSAGQAGSGGSNDRHKLLIDVAKIRHRL